MNRLEAMAKRLEAHKAKKARKTVRPSPPPAMVTQPPPLPVPSPARTTIAAESNLPETLHLIGGQNLDVGDVFWENRKFVIRKITKTAGTNTVTVEAECVKKHWGHHWPNQ